MKLGKGRFVDEVPAPLAACIPMIVLIADLQATAAVHRGPAALTTRACAPMGLGTGPTPADGLPIGIRRL